jgi:hypothetical protein
MECYRRIDGSPNFRRVSLLLQRVRSGKGTPTSEPEYVTNPDNNKYVCGRYVLARSVRINADVDGMTVACLPFKGKSRF